MANKEIELNDIRSSHIKLQIKLRFRSTTMSSQYSGFKIRFRFYAQKKMFLIVKVFIFKNYCNY